jgi:hypothetical protein
MEQRNGRLDRRLQRSPVVRCHYFVLPQRPEDRVLDALIRKTQTIQSELGSLTPVIAKNISQLLEQGISHDGVESLTKAIEKLSDDQETTSSNAWAINTELEEIRLRQRELTQQIEQLQGLLKKSRDWLQLDDRHFRDAISASLEILGANPLSPLNSAEVVQNPETARWEIPLLDQRMGADPTWATTLDTLRKPRQKGQKPWEWRKECPIRPVIFRDPGTLDGDVVHLHLEHRVVQRLLGRFLAQGFLHDELNRVCVCLSDDPLPKVIALGRLSLYGANASRLHDEIVAIAAEWVHPEQRGRKKLKPLTEGQKDDVLALLEQSLTNPRLREVPDAVTNLLQKNIADDINDLLTPLNSRAELLTERAKRELKKRGEKEASDMKLILEQQKQRILEQQEKTKAIQLSLSLWEGYPTEEKRQIEADRRYWEKRVLSLIEEIETEPQRIQEIYQVKAQRIDPVGLVYLYPVSG